MSSRPAVERPDRVTHAAVSVIVLAVTVLPLLLIQLAIPGRASAFAETTPEVAYLVVPYSVAAILFIACIQVVLLAASRLLWLSGDGRLRTRVGLRWVDVIVACAAIATGLCIVVQVHMVGYVPSNGGTAGLFIMPTIIGGLVSIVLLVRWRRRLVSALQLPDGGAPTV